MIIPAYYVMKVVIVTGVVKASELKGKWRKALIVYTFGKASLFDLGRRPKLPTPLVPTGITKLVVSKKL